MTAGRLGDPPKDGLLLSTLQFVSRKASAEVLGSPNAVIFVTLTRARPETGGFDASASGGGQSLAFVKKPSHGTTVMMLYVMVNCNVVAEKDAEVLINAE
jgi:hypothetical protein